MHTALASLLLPHIPITLADDDKLIAMTIVFVAIIVLVGIGTARKVLETRDREQTKREVAAYVAEGTIRPEDAAIILQAGSTETEQKIADGVAWGTIKPEKAEALLRTLRSDSKARQPSA